MRKTPLNNDIVHLIMDRADRAVVSNMMLTCQHYNRVGARYLLKWTVGLHPDDARQIESFVGFMTTDCNRYRFLRSLAITLKTTEDRYRPSGPQLALLADFFTTLGERGTNFTSLVFEEAEQVLDGHPALGNAMSLLRTLTALEISHVGRRTAAMLRDLRSRLHDVTFTACDHDYDPAMPADDRNPMLLFQASQSTLLHICASNFESSFGGPRYSNVTSLTITLNTTLVTLHLVYAFPNLRVLEVWECSLSGFTDYIRYRDENLAAQRIYGSWASLDRFGGSASMLYVLGLTCPITTVNFGYDFDINAADPDMLRQMITDARPVHLSVHIPHGHELLNYDLVAMLSEPCMDPVRSLHLHVELGLHDLRCDLDLAAVLVSEIGAARSNFGSRSWCRAPWKTSSKRRPRRPSASPSPGQASVCICSGRSSG